MNHNRLENEDLNAYALRLYANKSEYELNSQDIADILNNETGKNFSESAWRKKFKNFQRGIDYAKKNTDLISEDINKLEEKKREIIKEKDRLSIIRKEYNASIKKKSRQELFYENIGKEIKKDVDVITPIGSELIGDNDYILTIADIHAGSHFTIDKNKYSYEIITQRFNYLLGRCLDFINDNAVEHMNVLCLSDTVQGILRKSDLKLNESSVVEAVVFISKTISSFLRQLSKYVIVDYYHCPTGNHTQVRNLGSERNELKDEDVEFIIGNYIKDSLSDDNNITIHTNFGKDYIEFACKGNNIIGMHGHTIKNVDNAIKDISFHNRKFYDILFLAHFHGGSSIVNGMCENKDIETYVVPSFIGTCPYSDSIMRASKPSCMIYTINDDGVTGINKIILKEGI